MSHLQWLGIWAMTGFSKPEKKDVSKWTKGIAHVLEDPKGKHYFGEFLREPGTDFGKHVKILELWDRCDKFNKAAPVNQNEAQKILDEAQLCLYMTPCDVSALPIESQNDEIKELVKQVQEMARDNLIPVHKIFADSISQNRSNCLIL